MPRFSEDLDFILVRNKNDFNLEPYIEAIKKELTAFGFVVDAKVKNKAKSSKIESAFIKANSYNNFFEIKVPQVIAERTQKNEILKVKLEVDICPPYFCQSQVRHLLHPIPFYVRVLGIEDLFAGKVHAILARSWGDRVKGRDYYDFIWFVGQGTLLNLDHLKARLIETGFEGASRIKTIGEIKVLLDRHFQKVNFEKAKNDIFPFLSARERDSLALWNVEFFQDLVKQIGNDGQSR